MSEWRYMPGGSVTHALGRPTQPEAACGRYRVPAEDWMGSGSQVEYETAESLPKCKQCRRGDEA